MNRGRRQFFQLATSSVSLWFLNRAAIAQESYPSRPIHLIVGFTPGTAADITARAFSNGATNLLGQQIVVEDKAGAGSSVAAEYVDRHQSSDESQSGLRSGQGLRADLSSR